MAEERRKERMRGTGDKVEGRTMEEESALLVTGRKALMPKSFWFYSQENNFYSQVGRVVVQAQGQA